MTKSGFIISLSLTMILAQQVLIGLSTWMVAVAAKSLSSGNYENTILYVIWFFLFAILAYLLSMLESIVRVAAYRLRLKEYHANSFAVLVESGRLYLKENVSKSENWLAGEATSTLEEVIDFVADSFSVITNVFITLVVFYFGLGAYFSIVFLLLLAASVLVVMLAKSKIQSLALQSQDEKLAMNQSTSLTISGLLKNPRRSEVKIVSGHLSRVSKYGLVKLRVKVFEQLASSVPIILCVSFSIIYLINLDPESKAETVAVLVALMPRTLQLLGNVHAIGTIISQSVNVKARYKALVSFFFSLGEGDFDNRVLSDHVKIVDSEGSSIDLQSLNDRLQNKSLKCGRYRVSGKNGSGKSMLLKKLKSRFNDAYLLTTGGSEDALLSTGQQKAREIKQLESVENNLILLDEWYANLDTKNFNDLDEIIDKIGLNNIVIEVVHNR